MENIIHNSRRGRSADGSPASFYNRCPAAAMQSAAEADAQRIAGVPPASSGSVPLPVPLAFSLVFQNWLACPQSVRPRSITRSNCSQNPQRLVRVNPGKSGQKNFVYLAYFAFQIRFKSKPSEGESSPVKVNGHKLLRQTKANTEDPRENCGKIVKVKLNKGTKKLLLQTSRGNSCPSVPPVNKPKQTKTRQKICTTPIPAHSAL